MITRETCKESWEYMLIHELRKTCTEHFLYLHMAMPATLLAAT